jgi:hypothetical protein
MERSSILASDNTANDEKDNCTSRQRRDLMISTSSAVLGLTGIDESDSAEALNLFEKKGRYVLDIKDELSASMSLNEQVEVFPKLSCEVALLRVLPVKNTIFRTVEQNLEAISVLRYRRDASKENIDKAWAKAASSVDTALSILTNKRKQLEPVFNSDNSADVATIKAERGEFLLNGLSQDFDYLKEAIEKRVCSAIHT